MHALAPWLASLTTALAAILTAANLGARTTGWGFVVFMLGSLGWVAIGVHTGQAALAWTNAFLTVINAVGVWRWLGRQARYQDDARAVVERSRERAGPALVTARAVLELPVEDHAGQPVGHVMDVLFDGRQDQLGRCRLRTLVVRIGGIDERLVELAAQECHIEQKRIVTTVAAAAITRRPDWQPGGRPAN